jgi:hypothetical protein
MDRSGGSLVKSRYHCKTKAMSKYRKRVADKNTDTKYWQKGRK